jgi:hypothetical protein
MMGDKMESLEEIDEIEDGVTVGDDDDARADAFAAARKAAGEIETVNDEPKRGPGRPKGPPKTAAEIELAKRKRRLRDVNRRREAKGLPALTLDDLGTEIEHDGGIPGATPLPPADGEPRAVRQSSRMTRADLEAELEAARSRAEIAEAEVAARSGEGLSLAIGETLATVWDVARTFTPSPSEALQDEERKSLGDAWAPVLAPYLGKIAGALPVVAAVGVTYRVFAPKVSQAMREPGAVPVLDRAREVSAPIAPVGSDAAGSFPRPMGVATGDGYSPND